MTEFELMELLGVGLKEVSLAVDHISKMASPPQQTVRIYTNSQAPHLAEKQPTFLFYTLSITV